MLYLSALETLRVEAVYKSTTFTFDYLLKWTLILNIKCWSSVTFSFRPIVFYITEFKTELRIRLRFGLTLILALAQNWIFFWFGLSFGFKLKFETWFSLKESHTLSH